MLPLVLLLAGGVLYAAKRGWLRLPGMAMTVAAPRGCDVLRVVQSLGVGPGVRLVVVEFDGRPLLLAVHRGGVAALSGDRG
jgi:flagellar biogenesis protein FliO